MATPSRFSLTGWNSTYLAPRNVNGTAITAPAPAATTSGTSMGSIGSMTADVPAALTQLVKDNNQSDAVRALSEALQLAIQQGGGASGGGSADLITALSQAQQRNKVWDTIMADRNSQEWQRQKTEDARREAARLTGFGFGGTGLASREANLGAAMGQEQLDYLRTMSANWLNPLTASSIAPKASLGSAPMATSGWVSQSLVR